MKNTTACALCRRASFAVSSGRISSIDAPVVPITLASVAPSASNPVFFAGVPRSAPRKQMPPAIVNSENRMTTNGTYSSSIACAT